LLSLSRDIIEALRNCRKARPRILSKFHLIHTTMKAPKKSGKDMKDIEVRKIIAAETARQKKVINLIPSENYVSDDVRAAVGSVFDNKYAEGYPFARYYGGNQQTDIIESLCAKRALKLFGLKDAEWHVNCQALSGSPANLAVYMALVPHAVRKTDEKGAPAGVGDATAHDYKAPGKIMGMLLSAGGHLTHGQKVSATGKFWQPINYGVDVKTETINYVALRKQALAEKPDLIVAGFTAYPRIVDWAEFRAIADACGALLMVDMSHIAGLVAGRAYPSPFPYADVVTTTTHKTLRCPRGALIFARKNFLDKKGRFGSNGTGMSVKGKDGRNISSAAKNAVVDLGKKIDKAVFPGLQGGPHMSHIAGITVALGEAMRPEFKTYAKQVIRNAKAFGDEFKKLGWRVISGGTDSHLLLIDTWMNGQVTPKGTGAVPGKVAEAALEAADIICNKNTIPGESRSPFDPSGIRVGTPAETTRGRKEADFRKIAQKIDQILRRARQTNLPK
jgi:glycine hydroxymethyltransferase